MPQAQQLGLDWWEAYERYRQTAWWAEKRARVIERAHGICEGCANRKIAEIHHLRYPAGAWPGSDAWIRAEKLFDLVGLCQQCHQDLHARAPRDAKVLLVNNG